MSMEGRLPFERGQYTCGAVDVGAEFYDPGRKQWIQIFKNTDAASVYGKRAVKWETAVSHECDHAVSAVNGIMVAGIVDPVLGSNYVPVNAYGFMVVSGVCTVAIGSGTNIAAAGELLIIATTAIALNKGKLKALTAVAGAVGLLTAELTERTQVIAVSHAACSADSTNDVEVHLCLRR